MTRHRITWSCSCIVLIFSLLSSAGCWGALLPTETFMVPMDDGIRLATDYYLPEDREGPFPVVLTRSVYGRVWAGEHPAPKFTGMGIAFVVQDTRGRGDSEGVDMVFADDGWGEHRDGYDTVRWIQKQPWSNGVVGTWGASALGLTQLLLAGSGADLQGQSILVAASDFYGELSYQGGVWRKSLCEGWLQAQKSPHVIDLWKNHTTRDAFWRDGYDITTRAAHVTAPAIHLSGWFDIFAQGSIENFLSRQAGGGEGARGNQILVMGPWPHDISRKAGDLMLRDNYGFDIGGLEHRFYRHWLLGEETDLANEPAVHYYTLGDVEDPDAPGNEWRTADNWPPFETTSTSFYLGEDGGLHETPDGRTDGALTYAFDPGDPVPTHGGQNLLLPAGPYDQRQVSGRSDVLTFTTPPLEAPMEITGRVVVDLYVSTDVPDTDFTAKLVDIYPDGREILMLDSIRRLKFRHNFEHPAPYTQGDIVRISLDLWSISLIVNKGHRIGLHVSSSNYPRFEVNPNTGDDFPSGDTFRVSSNTVHMSAAHPSRLLLPVRNE